MASPALGQKPKNGFPAPADREQSRISNFSAAVASPLAGGPAPWATAFWPRATRFRPKPSEHPGFLVQAPSGPREFSGSPTHPAAFGADIQCSTISHLDGPPGWLGEIKPFSLNSRQLLWQFLAPRMATPVTFVEVGVDHVPAAARLPSNQGPDAGFLADNPRKPPGNVCRTCSSISAESRNANRADAEFFRGRPRNVQHRGHSMVLTQGDVLIHPTEAMSLWVAGWKSPLGQPGAALCRAKVPSHVHSAFPPPSHTTAKRARNPRALGRWRAGSSDRQAQGSFGHRRGDGRFVFSLRNRFITGRFFAPLASKNKKPHARRGCADTVCRQTVEHVQATPFYRAGVGKPLDVVSAGRALKGPGIKVGMKTFHQDSQGLCQSLR